MGKSRKTREENNAYQRAYRLARPDKAKQFRVAQKAASKRLAARKRVFLNWLKAVPCSDCGLSFPPYCMDFDHIGLKTRSPSILKYFTTERIQKELMNCQVVCAICHRKRTHKTLARRAHG